jgi:hypothetical protein
MLTSPPAARVPALGPPTKGQEPALRNVERGYLGMMYNRYLLFVPFREHT